MLVIIARSLNRHVDVMTTTNCAAVLLGLIESLGYGDVRSI